MTIREADSLGYWRPTTRRSGSATAYSTLGGAAYLLTMGIDPSPIGLGIAFEGDVCASDFEPVAGVNLISTRIRVRKMDDEQRDHLGIRYDGLDSSYVRWIAEVALNGYLNIGQSTEVQRLR